MLEKTTNPIVVHLSSVHNGFDPRIFYKECKSLAEYGYNIKLVIPFEKSEELKLEGIYIIPLRKPNNRLYRIVKTINQVRKIALNINGDLYHFHDPELIPVGLFLKMKGKKVIYDIHEDYLTSIQQKQYLGIFRFPISWLFFLFEKISSNFLELVLAEKYYSNRFPRGTVVCNYPILSKIKQYQEDTILKSKINKYASNSVKLIYTGNVTECRGALIQASIINLLKNIELYFVGRCQVDIAEKIRDIANKSVNKVHIIGENSYVNYETILEFYTSFSWTAALAIFPSTPHYKQKELTKIFEYMAFGIPVICSNFPVWKTLVEDNGVGLSVDPQSENSIVKAVTYLKDNPNEAKEMGNRGKNLVYNQYNWESESKKLLQLYQNFLESH